GTVRPAGNGLKVGRAVLEPCRLRVRGEDAAPFTEPVVHGQKTCGGLGLVVLIAFASHKDRVVRLERLLAAPQGTGRRGAVARDAVRQRGAFAGRAEALVDVDPLARARGPELPHVDTDAVQKARHV